MAETPPASLRLRIDGDALASNWRALNALSGAAKTGAAVKADAYGLGVDHCVPILRDTGAEDFFVAHWSEVEAVARHVPANNIVVLHGPMTDADVRYCRETGAVPVINSLEQARRWNSAGDGVCHLMVDTGINRLGIAPTEISDPTIQSLQVHTLMSHLACADEDSAKNKHQLSQFQSLTQSIPHQRASLANSAGIALGSEYSFDITRPGLSLYGGIAREELADAISQVAFPEAAIIQTRTLSAGDSVGYNATFTASAAMPVGVVSLGYADGILRSWAGGHFLHGNSQLPILGKVSMDMIVIDLAKVPTLREGDWVSIPYSLPNAAQQTALSQYELLTILGQRFARN